MVSIDAPSGDVMGDIENRIALSPELFRDEAVSDETRQAVHDLEELLKTVPPIYEIGAEVVREARRNGQGLLGMEAKSETAYWLKAPNGDHEVPIRIFEPEGKSPHGLFIHIHGGGHTIGAADNQDETLTQLSNNNNIVVASLEYRLAPENPWPAGPDDCEAASLWLIENADRLFGTDHIAIGGESAGAHLSATTLIRLRDRHGYQHFRGALLTYGIFDMSYTPSTRLWGDRNLIINTRIVEWFCNNLLPPHQFDRERRREPELSPLFADLTGLPKAHFTVGTWDPILDDTLFMAQRWIAAGNEAELFVYPGGIHAFDLMSIPIARQARERMSHFIGNCFPN